MEARDLDGHTPLMIAIRYDYPTIVELLLEHGADFEAPGSS
jgi:ankyrin repeat protein